MLYNEIVVVNCDFWTKKPKYQVLELDSRRCKYEIKIFFSKQ